LEKFSRGLNGGVPVSDLQDQLEHASLATTNIYLKVNGWFGKWTCDVSFDPEEIPGAIGKAHNFTG
jgi:hypothetical protein